VSLCAVEVEYNATAYITAVGMAKGKMKYVCRRIWYVRWN